MHVCLLYFLDIVTNYYFKAKSVDSFRNTYLWSGKYWTTMKIMLFRSYL